MATLSHEFPFVKKKTQWTVLKRFVRYKMLYMMP